MSPTKQDRKAPRSRRLDAYVRVSQVAGREGDSFISPGPIQEQRILAWAQAHGHEIIEVHRELDVSGGSMDRPLLNEAIRRIDDGETDGIVVYNLSRFARTWLGSMELIEHIHKRDALFASVSDGFDITTVTGRMVLGILLSVSVSERERAQELWQFARTEAIDRGVSLLHVAPFGYLRRCGKCGGELKPGTRRDRAVCLSCSDTGTGVLVVDPDTAPVLQELFRRRAAAYSWSALCDWLNDGLGLRTSYGNRFVHQTLMGIIANRTYLGEAAGATAAEAPTADVHPRLVDDATWQAAQQARRMGEGRGGYPTVAQGLVRCASCRYTMSVARSSAYEAQYYCRRSTSGARNCPGPTTMVAIAANGSYKLDEYVVQRFFEHAEQNEALAFEAGDAGLDQLAGDYQAALELVAETEADSGLFRQMGARSFGVLMESLVSDAQAAKQALDEANARIGGAPGLPIAELRRLWPTLPLDVRRRHLAGAIQYVFVRAAPEETRSLAFVKTDLERTVRYYSSRVHIIWADAPAQTVPRRGVKGYVVEPFVFPDGQAV